MKRTAARACCRSRCPSILASSTRTIEMCEAQGVEPGNMAAYMSMAKKDLMLVPADEPYSDCSLEIYIRVKDDNDYGVDSFSALSPVEYALVRELLGTLHFV